MAERRIVGRRLIFDEDDAERGPNGDIADEADINDFLQQELARIDREAMEKWNFDFKNEVPLEGQWQWIRVSPPEATTAANQQSSPEAQPQSQEVPEHQDQVQQEEENDDDDDDEPNR